MHSQCLVFVARTRIERGCTVTMSTPFQSTTTTRAAPVPQRGAPAENIESWVRSRTALTMVNPCRQNACAPVLATPAKLPTTDTAFDSLVPS